MAELTFDHAERMLDGRANRRLHMLDSTGQIAKGLIVYRLGLRALGSCVPGGSLVSSVTEHYLLFAVEQIIHLRDIGYVRRRRHYAIKALRATAPISPAEDLRLLHDALKGTVGAAAAVTRVAGHGVVDFSGIGNIEATLVTQARRAGLMSYPGAIGERSPAFRLCDTC